MRPASTIDESGITQARTVVRAEILHFLRDPINVKLLALLPPAVFAALWPYIGSTIVPALAATLLGLEPKFNNVLFQSPNEGEALLLFPSRWRNVVAAKNSVALILTLLLFLLYGLSIGYFAPSPVDLIEWKTGLLYLFTVVFPLLHFGNFQSVQHPRRRIGWSLGDLAEGCLFLIMAGICSIPFAIFVQTEAATALCLAYGTVGGLFWWKVSLPRTARMLASGSFLEKVEE
jgi:hypothetical protein